MCTVTLIPKGNTDFLLTSNRDESPNRETTAPNFYTINNRKILFPKDALAGGTWIGVSDRKRVVCLLNGGFSTHNRKKTYRLSRGVVVKDLLSVSNAQDLIANYNFVDIEPFTIVMVEWQSGLQFFEFVWDGTKKHVKQLPLESKIWSSSALYNSKMKQARNEWFEQFKSHSQLTQNAVLQFHKNTHIKNTDYGVIMNRGFVKTTSVTQIVKKDKTLKMTFENLKTNQKTHKTATF